MSKVKVKLNSEGVRALLQSEECQSLVKEYAGRIQKNCGEGYETSVVVGRYRARASVAATTEEARRDNMENNTILKAVRG